MSEDNKEFTIKDKRRFSESASADPAADESAAEAGDDSAPPSEDAGSAEPRETAEAQLPMIDFATFVFSLNSAVLVHLGVMEDPATGQGAKNLPMAKQTIDILGMLEEKTRGNLTSDEENMLKNILYDLRIRYVRETS